MSTKRKDGRLQKAVMIDGVRHYVYGYTEREINEKISELWDEKYTGITNDITYAEYSDHWLDVGLTGKAQNTIDLYTKCNNTIKQHIGNLRMQDIKRSEIEKVLKAHEHTPSYAYSMLVVVRSVFNFAIDDEICRSNPAANIKHKGRKKQSRDRLSKRDTDAIKNIELSECMRLFVDILYNTGMRKGEALGLSRKSIGDGVIHIREQRQFYKNGSPYITKLKTSKALRDIPITKELEFRIREYMKNIDSIYLFEEIGTSHKFDNAWIAVRVAIVRYYNPEYQPKRNKYRCILAKSIPCKITPHTLRHNYASILHDKGIDVLVARDLLGHENIATTLEIYTHLDKENQTERFDDIRDIFEAM